MTDDEFEIDTEDFDVGVEDDPDAFDLDLAGEDEADSEDEDDG